MPRDVNRQTNVKQQWLALSRSVNGIMFKLSGVPSGRRPKTTVSRRAYTLIELAVVITLSTLLTSIAVVSLVSPHKAARKQREAEAFIHFERVCRTAARRDRETYQMQFDLGRNVVECTRGNGEHFKTISIRGGIDIRAVRVRDRVLVDNGRVTVPINRRGISPTYGISLDDGDQSWWLLIAGGSGFMVEIEKDRDVEHAFQAIEANGADVN